MRTAIIATAIIMLFNTPSYAANDVARGETLYESRCGACHSIQSNRIGPKHLGVVGRKAGSVAGFEYSPALKKAKFTWTPAQLDKWLQGPGKLVRGTSMAFTVTNPDDRKAIIAYLAVAK